MPKSRPTTRPKPISGGFSASQMLCSCRSYHSCHSCHFCHFCHSCHSCHFCHFCHYETQNCSSLGKDRVERSQGPEGKPCARSPNAPTVCQNQKSKHWVVSVNVTGQVKRHFQMKNKQYTLRADMLCLGHIRSSVPLSKCRLGASPSILKESICLDAKELSEGTQMTLCENTSRKLWLAEKCLLSCIVNIYI